MIGWKPEIDGDKCHLLVHVERGRRPMMLLGLHDAEREGDVEKVTRCWSPLFTGGFERLVMSSPMSVQSGLILAVKSTSAFSLICLEMISS